MKRALAHAHLHWLLQVVIALYATAYGGRAGVGWGLLLLLLVLLTAAVRMAFVDLRPRAWHALGACVLGQLPGLLFACWVAGGIVHVFDEPFGSIAWLQSWTIAWTPLWSLLPDGTFHHRGYYIWALLALPLLQLGLTLWLAGARPAELLGHQAQRLGAGSAG